MKIYEITSKTSNEQELNHQLIKLYEATSATPTPDPAAPSPGILARSLSAFINIMKAAKLFFIIEPFVKYWYGMKDADAELKQSGNTPAAQKKYNDLHDYHMGLLITSVAAGLASGLALRTVAFFLGWIKYIPIIGPIIVKAMGLLSLAGQTWLLHEIASDEGRTKLAELITFSALKGMPFIGHLGNSAFSYFEQKFNEAIGMTDEKKGTTAPNADASQSGTQGSESPESKPKDSDSFTADLFDLNRPVKKEEPTPNEYLGPRLQRNPTTGRVEMKPLQ